MYLFFEYLLSFEEMRQAGMVRGLPLSRGCLRLCATYFCEEYQRRSAKAMLWSVGRVGVGKMGTLVQCKRRVNRTNVDVLEPGKMISITSLIGPLRWTSATEERGLLR